MCLSKELLTPRAFVIDACGTLFDVQSVVVRAANLPGDWQAPSPRVYALAPEVLGFPPEEIVLASSSSWDVAGAESFGYWCNRCL